jgi:hypothetical protein
MGSPRGPDGFGGGFMGISIVRELVEGEAISDTGSWRSSLKAPTSKIAFHPAKKALANDPVMKILTVPFRPDRGLERTEAA